MSSVHYYDKIYTNDPILDKIELRGNLNEKNIFICVKDAEELFNIKITTNIILIQTETNLNHYISYNDLESLSSNIPNLKFCKFELFVQTLDNLVYGKNDSCNTSLLSTIDDIDSLTSNLNSDIDSDRESINTNSDNEDNFNSIDDYVLLAFQYKIKILKQQLINKDHEIMIRDKEIEIIQNKLNCYRNHEHRNINCEWV